MFNVFYINEIGEALSSLLLLQNEGFSRNIGTIDKATL